MKFLCLLLFAFSSLVYADEARDQDIFASAPAPKKDEPSIKDNLTLGGRLSIDTVGAILENSTVGEALYEYDTTLYTYLDARPNEETRGFVRMRTIHPDPTLAEDLADAAGPRFDFDEIWIKIAGWDKRVYVTLGRQHVKWGTGRLWNPSDVLAPSVIDPLASYDYRLGTNLFKFHYPWEKEGANFYAIIDVDSLGIYKKPGAALRVELLVHRAELSATAYGREGKAAILASDVSMGLGPVDVYAEFVMSTNQKMTFYREGPADLRPLQTYSRKKQWIPQLVAGVKYPLQYAEQKHLDIGLEYFYNGIGYNNRTLELASLVTGQSVPLYAGRQYFGILLGLPSPGKLQDTSFYVSNLYNISDRSGLSRLSSQTKFFKEALLELWASASYGSKGEFRFEAPSDSPGPGDTPAGETLSATLIASGISRAIGASVSINF